MKKASIYTVSIVGLLSGAGAAAGQSLFQVGADAQPAYEDQAAPLYGYSLVAVKPPEPREFLKHDLITIVIRESSRVQREQTLETEKEHNLEVELIKLQALQQFLELRGPDATSNSLAQPVFDTTSEFTGEGEYERNDDVTARVTARVLEVKPNGTLLLEARTSVQTDEEVQTITLSGFCRTEDVSASNTVQSSELYDLRLDVQHEGEIKKSTEKGLIPRVFETLFNF